MFILVYLSWFSFSHSFTLLLEKVYFSRLIIVTVFSFQFVRFQAKKFSRKRVVRVFIADFSRSVVNPTPNTLVVKTIRRICINLSKKCNESMNMCLKWISKKNWNNHIQGALDDHQQEIIKAVLNLKIFGFGFSKHLFAVCSSFKSCHRLLPSLDPKDGESMMS